MESARRIFGEKGFVDTTLNDIAEDLNLTVTPIYHYFGNKRALFIAVTESYEQELAEKITGLSKLGAPPKMGDVWNILTDITREPGFVQVVLIDAPTHLGRERWGETSVVKAVSNVVQHNMLEWLQTSGLKISLTEMDMRLLERILIGALTEAAMMLATNPNYDSTPLLEQFNGLLRSFGTTRMLENTG